jgi:hypothetical protein
MRQVIIRNSIRCLRCGDEIVSTHRHDFRWCECGAVAVDGGQTWLRRVGDLSLIEETSIVEEEDGLEMMRRRAARADPAAVLKAIEEFGTEPPEPGDEIDE